MQDDDVGGNDGGSDEGDGIVSLPFCLYDEEVFIWLNQQRYHPLRLLY